MTEPALDPTEYAVSLLTAPKAPLRPLRAYWNGEMFETYDPDDPLQEPVHYRHDELEVKGLWDGPVSEDDDPLTWAQYAAHQYEQVLAQRDLVMRLATVGIKRAPEPYRHSQTMPNAIERYLLLNFDEISILLKAAGR